jgi:hypothetical protein
MKPDEPENEPAARDDRSNGAKAEQATDQEVQRERRRWAGKRRRDHLEYVKPFCFHTSSTFMDYLHGDVDEEESYLACSYEYARELRSMREAAKQRDDLKAEWEQAAKQGRLEPKGLDPYLIPEKAGLAAYEKMQLQGNTFFPCEGVCFLICQSFPQKDWQELTRAEREAITRFERSKTPPLPTPDVYSLKALGVFDDFKKMADAAKPVIEDVRPGQRPKAMKITPAILQQREGPLYQVVFEVDFSKGGTRLHNEFKQWLKLPEIERLLRQFHKPRTGRTGKPLDRLKDLAAWQLYRESGNDWNKANEFASKHRKRFTTQEIREYKTKEQRQKYRPGDPKPFRDARDSEADLFGEEADAIKAQKRAWEFLAEIAAREFAPPNEEMLAAFVEFRKLASEG